MIRFLSALAVLVTSFLPATLPAQEDIVDVSLLPGWRKADGRHMAAIEIRLAPGWKTYWRRPGEAGIPPAFDWAGSGNLATVQVHWPTPMAFSQNGLRSIGYRDSLVLPVELMPRRTDAPIEADLSMEIGVCRDICVPVEARLSGHLPSAPDRRPDARIRAALADRPLTAIEAGAGRLECRVDPAADGVRLTATTTMRPLGGEEAAAIELADPELWIGDTEIRRSDDRIEVISDIGAPRGQPVLLDRQALRLTVIGTNGAAEIVGCG